MVKDVISIHVGQAGVQIGNAVWELFCLEHGIYADGTRCVDDGDDNDGDGFKSFFSETKGGKFQPKALFVDLDPSTITFMKQSPQCNLFNNDYLIAGKEDGASNYSRGHNTVG